MTRAILRRRFAAAVAAGLCCAAAGAQQHDTGVPADRQPPPLFDNLGDHHRPVTTSSPSVQAYFDQGLRWLMAFNLEEAERSFAEALARDAECAMCWWGIGMAYSPHYNLSGVPERTAAGARAVAKGLGVVGDKPAIERELLEALAARLADPAPQTAEGFLALDTAYSERMAALAAKYPDDLDVQAFWAESLMNLRPWRLWEKPSGEPAPGTERILAILESVLERDPDHPGANHLYIHTLEASPTPERAAGAAERIARTMPGAAHIVHMPGHIWSRIGRWEDAAEVNRRAIVVDREYVARSPGALAGFYSMYFSHNYQFLWWAALMSGRYEEALANARAVVDGMPVQMLRDFAGWDFLHGYPIWTHLRFGRWAEALAEPQPPAEFPYLSGVDRAARGLALVELGRLDEARRELAEVERRHAALAPGTMEGFNSAAHLLGLARDWLAGELALAAGDVETGLQRLRAAVEAEDAQVDDDPPDWYYPSRPALGRALLRSGRAAEAVEVFAEDLRRFPENGWSLAGLAESQEAAGRSEEASATRARLTAAWRNADVPHPTLRR
jgi:tetratricopeptide (TPR) repeat protein